MERARARLRDQTEAMFAPELDAMTAADRQTSLAGVDTMLQFESAEHLRVRLGFDQAQANDILRRSVKALLT